MSPEGTSVTDHKSPSALRIIFACGLGLLAMGYGAAIVSGRLSEGRRLDVTSLALLAAAAIGIALTVNPGQLDRLKVLQMSGFKIEMLEQVRERQSEQALQLKDMALMLPLLLPAAERKHLLNLAAGRTSNYSGGHSLRSELRRLRSFDLLRMRPDRHVGMMKDGLNFDLKDFVELTAIGRRWAARISEIERGDVEVASRMRELDE
jgi:hypothetical protein